MKISIITVVYNNAGTIEDTILSVASQSHQGIEHVIVDGGSKDGTLAIIEKHRDKLAMVVSEPDRGIYDAMNKGLRLVTGEVVGFLNADDIYVDEGALEQVGQAFTDPDVDACYADLVYVDPTDLNKVVRFWKSREYEPGLFRKGWAPAHPTFFARKKIYDEYGGYDISYRLAADFELMLRFLDRAKIKSVYIPKVLVKMRLGGASNKNISNIIRQNLEILMAYRKNKIAISPFFIFTKAFSRLSQFYSKPIG